MWKIIDREEVRDPTVQAGGYHISQVRAAGSPVREGLITLLTLSVISCVMNTLLVPGSRLAVRLCRPSGRRDAWPATGSPRGFVGQSPGLTGVNIKGTSGFQLAGHLISQQKCSLAAKKANAVFSPVCSALTPEQ